MWIRCTRALRALIGGLARGSWWAIAAVSQALAVSGLVALAGSLVLPVLHRELAGPVGLLAELQPRGAWLVTGSGLLVGVCVLALLAVGVALLGRAVGRPRTRWTVALVTWAAVGVQVSWSDALAVGSAVTSGARPSLDRVEALLPGGASPLPVLAGHTVVWPVDERARVSSRFGWRHHPILRHERFHNGVDIAVAEGTPVLAAADGIVDRASEDPLNGRHVVLLHDDGLRTAYCHLRELHARDGQRVGAGQLIGTSGRTGRATGPHLHFGAWVHGRAVDPMRLRRSLAER